MLPGKNAGKTKAVSSPYSYDHKSYNNKIIYIIKSCNYKSLLLEENNAPFRCFQMQIVTMVPILSSFEGNEKFSQQKAETIFR